MILQLKADYPVKQICVALDCPVSTAYYQPKSRDEEALVVAIEHILMDFPFYGYRKMHRELLRQGWIIGEHVVRRLLRQLGVTRSVGKVRIQTTDSHHSHPRYPNRIKGWKPSRPNQV